MENEMGKIEYEIYLGLWIKMKWESEREREKKGTKYAAFTIIVDCYSKFENIFIFICACIAL